MGLEKQVDMKRIFLHYFLPDFRRAAVDLVVDVPSLTVPWDSILLFVRTRILAVSMYDFHVTGQ